MEELASSLAFLIETIAYLLIAFAVIVFLAAQG